MLREDYERAVEHYSDMVFRIALNECKNRADAEDVLQNTFLKLLQNKKDFTSEEHQKRWLIRVAVNECHRIFSSPWHKKMELVDDMIETAAFETPEEGQLFTTVQTLPAKYRNVLYLYYYEEYSIREISEILKIKESTLQTRLMRAREQLKEKLEGVWKDE
jgi:RNA polymerase sigma-70 factor (ECF subfamily)